MVHTQFQERSVAQGDNKFLKNFQNHRYTYEYMLYIEYGCAYSNLVKSYSPLKFVEDYVTENH